MCRAIRIHSRLWNDSQFNSLSDKSKLAYFFVTTHPNMTALGAMRASVPGLAVELGWSLATFQKAILELTYAGLVRVDAKAPLLWLPNFLKDNRPESPNVVKSWAPLLDELPECRELVDLLAHVKALAESWGDKFWLALPEAIQRVVPMVPRERSEYQSPQTTVGVAQGDQDPSVKASPKPSEAISSRDLPLNTDRPPLVLAIPETLREPRFLAAWSSWTDFCRDCFPEYDAQTAQNHLTALSQLGVDTSLRLLESLKSRHRERVAARRAVDEPELETIVNQLSPLPPLEHLLSGLDLVKAA